MILLLLFLRFKKTAIFCSQDIAKCLVSSPLLTTNTYSSYVDETSFFAPFAQPLLRDDDPVASSLSLINFSLPTNWNKSYPSKQTDTTLAYSQFSPTHNERRREPPIPTHPHLTNPPDPIERTCSAAAHAPRTSHLRDHGADRPTDTANRSPTTCRSLTWAGEHIWSASSGSDRLNGSPGRPPATASSDAHWSALPQSYGPSKLSADGKL